MQDSYDKPKIEVDPRELGYMRCYCGSWVVVYHVECLAIAPPKREEKEDE
jgi:hypothetical protein